MKKLIKLIVITNEPTKYSVRGVPTVLLFKGSKLLGTKVGAASEKDMLEFISPHI